MRTLKILSILVPIILLTGQITAQARAPVATNDTYSVNNDMVLSVPAPGVLANDFDSNGHALGVSPLTSQTFTFDGITFDQAFTPNSYKSLAAGTYSNAIVTVVPSGTASEVLGFPDSTAGFLGLLSVGMQFRDENSAAGTRALNLPAGNNGAANRSGFELGWTSGVMLTNLTGDDFVVFEAGSAGSPEAYMVQVHDALDDVWSPWVYITPQSVANYNGLSDVLFSTKFNLDSFGIAANGRVDAIRIANITDEDRMVDISGEGVVIPEDADATSTTLPIAPGGGTYANGSLDPDIVYVGGLHSLSATIPAYAATSELGATVSIGADGNLTYDPSTSSTLQALAPGDSMDDTFYYLVTDGFSGHTRGSVTVTVSAPLPEQPTLMIVLSGTNVVITWPTSAGYVLQSTDSLSDPEWTEVDIEPTEDAGNSSVTIDASTGNAFFRLISVSAG
jgi:VCBS repeat-containing protein